MSPLRPGVCSRVAGPPLHGAGACVRACVHLYVEVHTDRHGVRQARCKRDALSRRRCVQGHCKLDAVSGLAELRVHTTPADDGDGGIVDDEDDWEAL